MVEGSCKTTNATCKYVLGKIRCGGEEKEKPLKTEKEKEEVGKDYKKKEKCEVDKDLKKMEKQEKEKTRRRRSNRKERK